MNQLSGAIVVLAGMIGTLSEFPGLGFVVAFMGFAILFVGLKDEDTKRKKEILKDEQRQQ